MWSVAKASLCWCVLQSMALPHSSPSSGARHCACAQFLCPLEDVTLGTALPNKLLFSLKNILENLNQPIISKWPFLRLSKSCANFERFQCGVVLKWFFFFFVVFSFHYWPKKISHLVNCALHKEDKSYHRTKHSFSEAAGKWKIPCWSHCLLLHIQGTLPWPTTLRISVEQMQVTTMNTINKQMNNKQPS